MHFVFVSWWALYILYDITQHRRRSGPRDVFLIIPNRTHAARLVVICLPGIHNNHDNVIIIVIRRVWCFLLFGFTREDTIKYARFSPHKFFVFFFNYRGRAYNVHDEIFSLVMYTQNGNV